MRFYITETFAYVNVSGVLLAHTPFGRTALPCAQRRNQIQKKKEFGLKN